MRQPPPCDNTDDAEDTEDNTRDHTWPHVTPNPGPGGSEHILYSLDLIGAAIAFSDSHPHPGKLRR